VLAIFPAATTIRGIRAPASRRGGGKTILATQARR
jgi:hypothetical protein